MSDLPEDQWVDVKERLPSPINDNVLALVEGRFAAQGFVTRRKGDTRYRWMLYDMYDGDYRECPRTVTHWRPL